MHFYPRCFGVLFPRRSAAYGSPVVWVHFDPRCFGVLLFDLSFFSFSVSIREGLLEFLSMTPKERSQEMKLPATRRHKNSPNRSELASRNESDTELIVQSSGDDTFPN